jgi:translation elongation factor IF5A
MSKAKVGKHGAAKCAFTGIDIFNGKKLECIAPASAGLSQPIVERNEYEMCDISDDDFVTLMDAGGNMREDIKVPDDPETAKKHAHSHRCSPRDPRGTLQSRSTHVRRTLRIG